MSQLVERISMLNGASSPPSLQSGDRLTLARCLLRRAARQVALLRAASASLALAPTLDDRIGAVERAREDLLQLERAAQIYLDLTDSNLLTEAEQWVAGLSVPTTWFEASIAQLLLCLAARIELEEPQPHWEPLAPSLSCALACETEHLHAARAALAELNNKNEQGREFANQLTMRWLRVALGTLDQDAVRKRYLHAVAQELAPIGMRISA
jgi:hypothetical protein